MKFKKYISVFLALAILASCSESIIEIQPEGTVTREIALAKTAGINALIVSAYRRMHEFGYYGQSQILNAEALADNLVIANNTGRYTGQVVNGVGNHFGTWGAAPYNVINDCNIALKYVDATLPNTGQSDASAQADRDRYKGEALFLRAFAYHDLVKVYGYEPGREVGGWNLGVILRTTPTEGVSDANKRARSTNQEVYDQIEADLLAAIPLLPAEADVTSTQRGYRASKAAAKALLARVYLFLEDFDNAETFAQQAMAETAKTFVSSANFVNSWAATQHVESILEFNIQSADWSTVDGVNNSMASVTNSTSGSNAQFAVAGSQELIDAHEGGDVRLGVWVDNGGRWECKKWRGELGDFRENIPVIRVSEVALILAEARARKAAPDEAGARTILNQLRSNRGLGNTALSGQALIDLIMNERRVELAFEGHRFFDLKRNEMDITKPASLGVNDVPYTDYRILGNIPNGEVIYNELLDQNPNY